jgi:chemotaxis protein histidine kinase CheA
MRARPLVLGILTALLAAAVVTDSRAEAQQAVDKIVALNKAAVASFTGGQAEKAKDQLMEAVVLGKENGLGMHAAMARTYVHLGVVYVDGLKDKEKGQRYFVMAQKVRPDIEVTPALASKTVMAVFDAARAEQGKGPAVAKTEAKPEVKAPAVDPKADARAKEKADKAEKEAAAEAARTAKEHEKAEKAAEAETAKAAAATAAAQRKESEAKDREQKLRGDNDKVQKELAQLRDSEKKERTEKERLQKELAEKDKQLAEARAGEKKEREAREKLEKQNQESGKQLAEASGREKKEREAREKLEKEKLQAAAQEKARKDQQAQLQAAREKLVDGPDLPGNIPQPLHCPTADGVVNTELFIHCVPQAQVKAKALVLYYRPSGVAHFDAITMAHSRKGWWTAAIPANRVAGKTLQFYAEARGAKDEVAATNGKADSPNILVLHTASEAPLASKTAGTDDLLAKTAKPAAKRTPAAKRSKTHR